MDPVLRTLLLERLAASDLGRRGAARDRGRRATPVRRQHGDAAPPVWLRSVTVEGFRGIGAPATLPLEPQPGADRRRRPQRQRQVLVRRGARAADDRPAEALGEAPEGVDGDVAVPAPHRADADRRPSWCSRARASPSRSRRSGRTARGYDDASGRAAPAAVLAEHGWDRDLPSFRPVPGLRRAGDDVRHAVLAVRGADAGARAGRRRRARRRSSAPRGWPTTTSARRSRGASDALVARLDPDDEHAALVAARAQRPQARPRRARAAARATRRTTAATPRSCAASPGSHVPTDEEIRDAFTALRVRRARARGRGEDRRRSARPTSPRCCARRSRSATPSG